MPEEKVIEKVIPPGTTGKADQAHSFLATVEKIRSHVRKTAPDRISEIDHEFALGFELMKKYRKSVSIYGSARTKTDEPYYQKAKALAKRIASELHYGVVTGGGPGIMEAANCGAKEAGGDSIGFTISLPKEQITNSYLTDSLGFEFFFVRRVMLAFCAETYIFFPGGFGTLDELFEIITLVQTHKIPRVPIVLVGKQFWTPIVEMIRKNLLEDNPMISPADVFIYHITDDEQEILDIVKKAPLRKEYEE